MTDIIPAISGGPFNATAVGLMVPKEKVPVEKWLSYGAQLRTIQGAVRWAIGDWLNYGESRYGEMYSQAYTLFGEYSESSVRNMRRVAEYIPLVRRRTTVSWSAHSEIASLPQVEQEQWLDELERGMTRYDLRLALNGSEPVEKENCPCCGTLVDKEKIR